MAVTGPVTVVVATTSTPSAVTAALAGSGFRAAFVAAPAVTVTAVFAAVFAVTVARAFALAFFARAFVGKATAVTVHARWRWRWRWRWRRRRSFFAGAFVGKPLAATVDARRFVLVEAGAAGPGSIAAGEGERAARAEHQSTGGENRGEALPREESLLFGVRPCSAHRPRLHSVECQGVERWTPVAKRVGNLVEAAREALVIVV
jgi:stage V sporulation protein SpoVS